MESACAVPRLLGAIHEIMAPASVDVNIDESVRKI
jgi:hypothetical protein